jgi:hypothetical protein
MAIEPKILQGDDMTGHLDSSNEGSHQNSAQQFYKFAGDVRLAASHHFYGVNNVDVQPASTMWRTLAKEEWRG